MTKSATTSATSATAAVATRSRVRSDTWVAESFFIPISARRIAKVLTPPLWSVCVPAVRHEATKFSAGSQEGVCLDKGRGPILSTMILEEAPLPAMVLGPAQSPAELQETGEELGAPVRGAPLVDIVVPVYNEERILASSIWRLRSYLDFVFPFAATVTIVDNASTDRTFAIASRLEAELDGVRVLRLEERGRGRALRTAWCASEAQVVAYMDVDLSTSLDALLPLVAPIVSGHSSMSIGTRMGRGARVTRSAKRELISRSYVLLVRLLLRVPLSDAQCGFKALDAGVARRLLARIRDDEWFFDTELLAVAHREGLRIHEVPVDWIEDHDSRVDIVSTASKDLRGILRLLGRRAKNVMKGDQQ